MKKTVVLSRWIFTEAQTGKSQLDTHYFFLNEIFQASVEDDNYIRIEDDIVKSASFNGDISGNTAVIVDAENIFSKRALEKTNLKLMTEAKETNEVCWRQVLVEVTKSSNVIVS